MECKTGTLKVTTTHGSGNTQISTFDIIEFSFGIHNVVMHTSGGTTASSMCNHYDVDLSDTTHLDLVFNQMGVNTYEWIKPMTILEDASGGIIGKISHGADLNDIKVPGTYYREHVGSSTNVIANVPTEFATSTFVLEVFPGGVDGQVVQRITRCDKTRPYVLIRAFYSNAWNEWGREFLPEGKILWSGGWHMSEDHTATFNDTVDKQDKGIELVFSRYSAGIIRDYSWNSFFVPKQLIAARPGQGHMFTMVNDATFAVMAGKYLYIHNDKIVGAVGNNVASTGNPSGLKYENNGFVLRYVIGV